MTAALGEIDQITREIHILEAHATERATSAIEFKIEIGRRLTRAKSMMPHGQFTAWAQREFTWNPRHVQKHMELARNAPRVAGLGPEASLRAALAAIAADPPSPEMADGAALHYVLALVLPGGEEIDLPLRIRDGEQLMQRELTTATLKVTAA